MDQVTELQQKRAVNLIWNAAQDYHFHPDFKAYDRDGNADVYWNCIIGAVRRHYDYPKLAAVFASFQQYEDGDTYEGLLWLGLENAVYQKELPYRPVMAELRRDYARRFAEEYSIQRLDDYQLYDCLAYAHYLRVLGEEPQFSRYDRKLLDELEFSPELDTDMLVELTRELFSRWFQITLEERKRDRSLFSFFHRRSGKGKTKVRYRKFGIGFADHPRHLYAAPESALTEEDQPKTSLSAEELRAFMTGKYGEGLFSSQQMLELERKLCTGNHQNCHLHFTKGVPAKGKIQNGFEALKKEQEKAQIQRNRRYYQEHLAENRTSIARLAAKIQNSVLLYLQPTTVSANAGLIDGGRVWRAVTVRDEKVFLRAEQGNMGDLSVDILLDASTSQEHRQEIVSTQGYMIAEALTRCSIPCRVMSFCSMTGYTILRIFRDYHEPTANGKIFDYVSNGCNRDGLALRAAHELMQNNLCEHKLLIILSDVKPHDAQRIPSTEEDEYRPYEREDGVRDAAAEVRRLRADGIAVICVFTGEDADLPSAKLVYGKDFARIQSLDKLADTVGQLIQSQMKNL